MGGAKLIDELSHKPRVFAGDRASCERSSRLEKSKTPSEDGYGY